MGTLAGFILDKNKTLIKIDLKITHYSVNASPWQHACWSLAIWTYSLSSLTPVAQCRPTVGSTNVTICIAIETLDAKIEGVVTESQTQSSNPTKRHFPICQTCVGTLRWFIDPEKIKGRVGSIWLRIMSTCQCSTIYVLTGLTLRNLIVGLLTSSHTQRQAAIHELQE